MVSLPITLSIMDSLIVEVRGHDFVGSYSGNSRDSRSVLFVLENHSHGRAMLKFNDKILPVAKLEEFVKIRTDGIRRSQHMKIGQDSWFNRILASCYLR